MTSTNERELLEVHEATRRAFLNGDLDDVAPHIGERGLSIAGGRVQEETLAEWRKRFGDVVGGATFDRWDDLEPPRIGVSADGTMAWLVEVVRTTGSRRGAGFDTRTARLTVFERRDGRWRRVVNATTTAPE